MEGPGDVEVVERVVVLFRAVRPDTEAVTGDDDAVLRPRQNSHASDVDSEDIVE